MQRDIVLLGLDLIESAEMPGSIERAPFHWVNEHWRDDYAKVDASNSEELRLRGERRRQRQAADKAAGSSRAAMISDA